MCLLGEELIWSVRRSIHSLLTGDWPARALWRAPERSLYQNTLIFLCVCVCVWFNTTVHFSRAPHSCSVPDLVVKNAYAPASGCKMRKSVYRSATQEPSWLFFIRKTRNPTGKTRLIRHPGLPSWNNKAMQLSCYTCVCILQINRAAVAVAVSTNRNASTMQELVSMWYKDITQKAFSAMYLHSCLERQHFLRRYRVYNNSE